MSVGIGPGRHGGRPFPHHLLIDAQYATTDWYLASFILNQGIPLAGWRRIGPKKVEFRFPAGRRLHHVLRLYWACVPTILVPVELFAAHRRLKTRDPLGHPPIRLFPHDDDTR